MNYFIKLILLIILLKFNLIVNTLYSYLMIRIVLKENDKFFLIGKIGQEKLIIYFLI